MLIKTLLPTMRFSLAQRSDSLEIDFMFMKGFAKEFEHLKYVNIYCPNEKSCHQMNILKSLKNTGLHRNIPLKFHTTSSEYTKQSSSLSYKTGTGKYYPSTSMELHFLPLQFILSNNCTSSYCNKVSSLPLQDENNMYLFKAKSPNQNFSYLFNTNNVNIKSNIYVYYLSNQFEYTVLEVYKIQHSVETIETQFAIWNTSHGFIQLNKLHKWQRRSNLTGLYLRYSSAIDRPFVMKQM